MDLEKGIERASVTPASWHANKLYNAFRSSRHKRKGPWESIGRWSAEVANGRPVRRVIFRLHREMHRPLSLLPRIKKNAMVDKKVIVCTFSSTIASSSNRQVRCNKLRYRCTVCHKAAELDTASLFFLTLHVRDHVLLAVEWTLILAAILLYIW